MPSANKTPIVGLNQWQGNEHVKRQDLVDDNFNTEKKIKELQEGLNNITIPVVSVNGKTGEVALTTDDIKDSNGKTVTSLMGEMAKKRVNAIYDTTNSTSVAYKATANSIDDYVDGMEIMFIPTVDCGTNATFALNNLSALTIKKSDNTGTNVSDLKANVPVVGVRVGSNFFIRSGRRGYLSSINVGSMTVFSDIDKQNNTSNYTKIREIKSKVSGNIRITIGMNVLFTNPSTTVYARVYINDIAVGIERSTNSSGSHTLFTEDFTIKNGDLIQVYAKTLNTSNKGVHSFKIGIDTTELFEGVAI